ncbi:3-dehydroquinate synthase [Riemerella columbina]|uniref:3-dehydroquinate synthase n=1 Tax=Riemerella columbina TaxID=103810 RepID=UPI00037D42AD|nr:3-dehydroquinate synthase [Riemerella columbina]
MITTLDKDFTALNQYIKELRPSQILILVDENTHQHCLPLLLGNLATDIPMESIELEAGEENKNLHTATQLWEIFSEFQVDRNALLINLGGGVITDMGGFVASTYKRGFKFIHLPTSLLAMADASIGGKTGIDHQFLKNIVGTFAFPEQIFVTTDFLKTLPYKELRSGFAEMLKHGLIADASHWEELSALETLTPEVLDGLIETSIKIKQHIVDQDFKEQNIRKTLNFGHTFGHAVESLFMSLDQPIAHGEAVAIGMIMETYLAFLEGLIPETACNTIVKKIQHFYPYISIDPLSNTSIMEWMKNDKKNKNGSIQFSLIDGIGSCTYNYKADANNIHKAIEFYKSLA